MGVTIMLIYEWVETQLWVTQVMMGFGKPNASSHKTSPDRIHADHRIPVSELVDGFVYVTGDTSVLGGGFQPRSRYERYLGYHTKKG